MRVQKKPALLGGEPASAQPLPITRPTLPPFQRLQEAFARVVSSGMLTNSENVRALEKDVASLLGVRHAVGLSSCTSGLMLVWKALNLPQGGEVIVPSFTFSATGHALLWNGLVPRFVDIEPDTLLMSLRAVESAINENTVGIAAVHTFGNPCYPHELDTLARQRGLKVVYDSAHALGSTYRGRSIGSFGEAEVFSLSPTKLVVAGEGGLVTTGDDELARLLRIGRDYGNPGNYDCEFAGLNARMSEFHAILARASLRMLSHNRERRNRLAERYIEGLSDLPGVSFQQVVPGGESTYKDFAIVIDPEEFGLTRDELAEALRAENISTRPYFYPPLHRQRAYAPYAENHDGLEVTERVSEQVLCLPIYSHMQECEVDAVCEAIGAIHLFHREIRARLSAG